MSKPPVLVWASDAAFATGPTAGAANKVAPTSGAIASGYEPDEEPTAEVWNHLMNRAGLWTSWLDGLFTDDDDLTIRNLTATGDAAIGDDLAVGGDASIAGDLTVAGAIKHGDRTLHIGAAAFVADSATGSLSQLGYITTTSVAKLYAPIALPAGKRIKSVTVYYDRNGSGSVAPRLERMAPATGTITTIWTGATDSTGSGIESQTDAATNHTMLSSDVYWISVTLTASGNRLYGAVITYDEP